MDLNFTARGLTRALHESAPAFGFSVIDGRSIVRVVVRMPFRWRVARAITFGLATMRRERALLQTAQSWVPVGVAIEMVVL